MDKKVIKDIDYRAHRAKLVLPDIHLPATEVTQLSAEALQQFATGNVSAVFGEKFRAIDQYQQRIRTAAGDYLFIDRVNNMQGTFNQFDHGDIWTQAEVTPDSWFIENNRVPPAIICESAQGFLVLCAWLGMDFKLGDGYVCRALGTNMTFYDLPSPPVTLEHHIHLQSCFWYGNHPFLTYHITCHANGKLIAEIADAKVGFFKLEDIIKAEKNPIKWDPNKHKPEDVSELASPIITHYAKSYSKEQINAFKQHDVVGCFGGAFKPMSELVQPPSVINSKLWFIDEIITLDHQGGPWQRGYLKARQTIKPDEWFFKVHFIDNPCMPASLVFQTAYYLLSFYLTALGFALDKDGFVFRPLLAQSTQYECREQIVPTNKEVIYELFIESLTNADHPAVVADVLITVDGVKAFHAHQQAIESVPREEKIMQKPKHPPFKLNREQLKIHASGKISEIYGSQFAVQDAFHRQVRMPEPPLLLADRVLDIQGEPGSMGSGVIWTETDVTPESWYLHEYRMPAGIMIESGQADLMLISWMGVDFLNKGERIYRLLGCDLTYHGPLAKPGETLHYEIHLDDMAKHGDIRLMFFHYDCKVNDQLRMSVRNGQAGFFTDQELAESKGVIWKPEEVKLESDACFDQPPHITSKRRFTQQDIQAFAEGRAFECFGDGFEYTCTHNQPPRIQADKMLFIHDIPEFNPSGGPLGRGYMRAVQHVTADDWFFKGHFKNDPCMPGTLMFEAGFQVIAFYLAALGYTIKADGWRFDVVPDITYELRCRGQCVPTSKEVIYEIYVKEIKNEPYPIIIVDLLATVDGLKAFLGKNFAVCLKPDFPLERRADYLKNYQEQKSVAKIDDVDLNYRAMLVCAWGRPSEAFGNLYLPFDHGARVPRLPGPPYHCMTRIVETTGQVGGMEVGSTVVAEYDVPDETYWYFADNSYSVMPISILMEVALQPCGWLASFVGSAVAAKQEVLFRNLDGSGVFYREITPNSGVVTVKVSINKISQLMSTVLEEFSLEMYQNDELVAKITTGFGFFPPAAFADQPGLAPSDQEKDLFARESNLQIQLRENPEKYYAGKLTLAKDQLLMLDRVVGFWPEAGEKGLGQLRAEKDVNPHDWYFKAHFYQDPVQPGSLGIEAICQLLQFYIIEKNLHADMQKPQVQIPALNQDTMWKYRGQVVPHNKLVTITMEITGVNQDESGIVVTTDASLWVDGKCIYTVKNFPARLVDRSE
jgi:3-hydroxymyristoyl/3-hydroxydecanoyl-(acyl carrier protein) dehydratase